MVGTRKNSTETKFLTWLLIKVRQVCEGGVPDHIFGDGCLREFDFDLQQLSVSARSTPAGIGEACGDNMGR